MKSARSRLLLGIVCLGLIGLFVVLSTDTAPRFPTFPPEKRSKEGAVTRDALQSAMMKQILKNHIVWPDPAPEPPFRVGVVGRDPFQEWTAEELQPVVCGTERDIENCRAVFVSKEATAEFRRVGPAVRGRAVVLFGEEEAALSHGAMIVFTLHDGRVRVRLNDEALRGAGLDVSETLKKQARAE